MCESADHIVQGTSHPFLLAKADRARRRRLC